MVEERKPIWAISGSRSVIYAGGAGGKLLALDFSSLQCAASTPLSEGWINGVALSECRSLVTVSTSRGELFAINTANGEVVTKRKTGLWLNGIKHLPAQREAQFLVATAEGQILLWSPHSDELKPMRGRHTDQVWMCSISNDGSQFVSCGGSGELALWDTFDRSLIAWLSRGGYTITCVEFLARRGLIASIDMGGAMTFWSVANLHAVGRLNAHSARAWGISANATETHVVTVGADQRIATWSTSDLAIENELHVSAIPTACNFIDDAHVCVGDRQGELRLIDPLGDQNRHLLQNSAPAIVRERLVAYLNGLESESPNAFSVRLLRSLADSGLPYSVEWLGNKPLRLQSLRRLSGSPLFPQLYLDQQFIGGSEVAAEMIAAGALHRLYFGVISD